MEDMIIRRRVKNYCENNAFVIALNDLKTKIKQVNTDIESHNTPRRGMFVQLYDTLAPYHLLCVHGCMVFGDHQIDVPHRAEGGMGIDKGNCISTTRLLTHFLN